MARKIVAGNWKMNLNVQEGLALMKDIVECLHSAELNGVEVVAAPPMLYLSKAAEATENSSLQVAAQNCSDQQEGAFTGEVSAAMLRASAVNWVILGHSERRQFYYDTDAFVNGKLKQAVEQDLNPILCVGESLEERKSNRQEEVVEAQLRNALEGLEAGALQKLVVAYEPVWAIGTGETASPEQAQQMHAFIRNYLKREFGSDFANSVSILYGGSVKPANAGEIFSQADVDGGLIGGASLKADSFCELIKIGAEVL